MKLHFSAARIVFVLALTVVIIAFSAFSQKGKPGKYSFRKETNTTNNDTPTPRLHDRYLNLNDLDKVEAAMKKLDAQMEKLDEQMKQMDLSKVQKEVDEALQKVDFEKIQQQIDESIKKMDYEKLKRNVRESVVSVENFDKLKVQMERAKDQLERQKENLALNNNAVKVNIEKAMKNAKESMLNAREELRTLKEFTDQLEKDGLIDKRKDFRIEVRSGELYINGKKQTKEVNDKYRKYYKKDNFSINSNGGEGVRI